MTLHSARPPRDRQQDANERNAHRRRAHEHHAVVVHALRQRAGVPYEVERTVCADCRSVLDERQLRRAAA